MSRDTVVEFLTALGLDLKLIVAGFAGGVVHAFFFRQTDPYTVVGSIMSGVFAANYLAIGLAKLSGFSIGTCGFVAGFGAMALTQGVVRSVQTKLGLSSNGGDSPKVR
jgi:hypothetical protein